jgi:hypothetical protein
MLKNYDEEILEILHNLDDSRKQEALTYLRSLQGQKGYLAKHWLHLCKACILIRLMPLR